ncbi:cytochrome c [Sphingomonas sp.]|uniref:c-type cytochrome n=1 Tax=Sphingomonas sp. TaxID=28214 RepID=UPI0025F16F42|nr:cytochrome c [Sphingomonas sp.]
MNRMLARALALAAAIAPIAIVATSAGAQFAGGYRYQSGQDLYTHICQGCHMPDGKGAEGAGKYPPLAGNVKLQSPLYPVLVMLKGQKAMPSFSDLTDAQIVEVTAYIRSNFGNSFAGAVTPEQVKALRAQAVRQNALRPG